MSGAPRPTSLVAERAVRFLREQAPVDSRRLAGEVLATRSTDETTARRVLQAAFSGDPRLVYKSGKWTLAEPAAGQEPARARRPAAVGRPGLEREPGRAARSRDARRAEDGLRFAPSG